MFGWGCCVFQRQLRDSTPKPSPKGQRVKKSTLFFIVERVHTRFVDSHTHRVETLNTQDQQNLRLLEDLEDFSVSGVENSRRGLYTSRAPLKSTSQVISKP